ncbi:MAG: recombinase RecT [Pseudomonadota bacterium]
MTKQSTSVAQRENLEPLLLRIDSASSQLAEYLPEGASVKRFVALAKRQVALKPEILDCSPRSVLTALGDAASSGLPIDGKFSSLIVRKSKNGPPTVSWDPSYRGMISLALASGQVTDVQSFAVTEQDEFDVNLGTDPKIDHRPALLTGGRLVAAYAYARLKTGRMVIELLGREDLDQLKKSSPAGERGPWGQWENQMARKSAIRRLLKKLPAAPVTLLSAKAEIPELIDGETGEFVSGQAPQHLSDEDIASGVDELPGNTAPTDPWVEDYENA